LLQVCRTSDLCYIKTHSIHKERDLQIYFGVIFRETRHHAQAHVTSGALYTDSSTVWLKISLASVGYGDSQVSKHFLRPHLIFEPIWGWGDLSAFQLSQTNLSPDRA